MGKIKLPAPEQVWKHLLPAWLDHCPLCRNDSSIWAVHLLLNCKRRLYGCCGKFPLLHILSRSYSQETPWKLNMTAPIYVYLRRGVGTKKQCNFKELITEVSSFERARWCSKRHCESRLMFFPKKFWIVLSLRETRQNCLLNSLCWRESPNFSKAFKASCLCLSLPFKN